MVVVEVVVVVMVAVMVKVAKGVDQAMLVQVEMVKVMDGGDGHGGYGDGGGGGRDGGGGGNSLHAIGGKDDLGVGRLEARRRRKQHHSDEQS